MTTLITLLALSIISLIGYVYLHVWVDGFDLTISDFLHMFAMSLIPVGNVFFLYIFSIEALKKADYSTVLLKGRTNTFAGAEIMSDKGYEIGTEEEHAKFVEKRNSK